MKNMKQKVLMMATVALIALPVSLATAASTNLHGKALFRIALTLSNTDMDFSKIDYSAAPAVGDTVTLATNNAETFAGGKFSAGTGAAPAAGTVTVTAGTVGQTVEISCTTTGVLSNAGNTSTIGIDNTEVTTGAGGAAGTGTACAGVGVTPATKVLAGSDVFKFGGRINGATQTGVFSGGAYDTSNAGGTNMIVQVVYQ